jgi:hypothetical protein
MGMAGRWARGVGQRRKTEKVEDRKKVVWPGVGS